MALYGFGGPVLKRSQSFRTTRRSVESLPGDLLMGSFPGGKLFFEVTDLSFEAFSSAFGMKDCFSYIFAERDDEAQPVASHGPVPTP